jgi:hypothetical protein
MEQHPGPRKRDKIAAAWREHSFLRRSTPSTSRATTPNARTMTNDSIDTAQHPHRSAAGSPAAQLSTSSTPPTSELWKSAAENLTAQQREVLAFEGDGVKLPNEVIKLAISKRDMCIEKQWKIKVNGKSIVLRDVAEKIFRWIDRFKAVGDLGTQFDPVHSALPWAAFRFLLQVCFSSCPPLPIKALLYLLMSIVRRFLWTMPSLWEPYLPESS